MVKHKLDIMVVVISKDREREIMATSICKSYYKRIKEWSFNINIEPYRSNTLTLEHEAPNVV